MPRLHAAPPALARVTARAALPADPPPPAAGPRARPPGPIRRTVTLGTTVDACPDLATLCAAIARRFDAARRPDDRAFLVTFVNPSSVISAERNPAYAAALQRFDLVLPDGIGMALAVRCLAGHAAARISFDTTSLALPALRLAADRGGGVALIGGKEGVARRAATEIARHLPQLRVAGTWSGYGDAEETVRAILAAEPAVVVCGMGAVVQEAFLLRLAASGWRGIGFTCGGYLDQLANGLHYYPAWVDRTNLRCAYRLAREPGRLWRRYVFEYGHFGLRFLQACVALAQDRRDPLPPEQR